VAGGADVNPGSGAAKKMRIESYSSPNIWRIPDEFGLRSLRGLPDGVREVDVEAT
jgi:hypothetical protein